MVLRRLATSLEAGDDREAIALVPLLDEIDDRYLEAVRHLALAWTAPFVGDRDEALREASLSVQQLRAQAEPFWAVAALVTTGALQAGACRDEEALRHLREGSDLAQRFDSARLAALVREPLPDARREPVDRP